MRSSPDLPPSPVAHDALALALMATALSSFVLWTSVRTQRLAQQPASAGVVTFHLGREGSLRLWNQPIRPQEVPLLLQRAQARSGSSRQLVVRLIPDPQVPWGVIQGMLGRLRPDPPQSSWVLQLQLP